MKNTIFFIILAVSVAGLWSLVIYPADAQGLVPCGGKNQNPCTPCDIFVVIQNILNFLIYYISVPLATIMLAYGGFLMMLPGLGGEKSVATHIRGKKVVTNAVIGVFIVFFSWLIIDTIIKVVAGQMLGSGQPALLPKTGGLGPGNLGPWNRIECKAGGQKISSTAPSATGQTGAPTGGVSTSPISAAETGMRGLLRQNNIGMNKDPCPAGKGYGDVLGGCTNVAGIPPLALIK